MEWRRNLLVLALGITMSSGSYTMVIPFLPLFLLDLGVAPADVSLWSGVVFSATFLVAAVLAPYWGRVADKTGKKRMVMRAGWSLAAVYLLGAIVHNPLELLLMRILQGVANGFVPAAMSIIAATAPKDKLGFSLGLMQTALLIGSILGPLAGGVLSHAFGMRSSFLVAGAAIGLGTLGVRFFVTEQTKAAAAATGSIIDDFKQALANRQLLVMLILLFLVQAASLLLQPLIALYLAELQGSMEGIALTAGLVYSLAGAAGAVAAPLWGRLGQQKGYFLVLTIAFCGAGIFAAGQYLAANIYWFAVLQFLFGLFIVGVYPAVNTLAVECTPSTMQGRLFGLTTTANQLGSMTGPVVGGIISAWLGIKLVFIFTGVLLILIGLAVALDHRRSGNR